MILAGLALSSLWSQPVSAWPSYDKGYGFSGTHAPAVGKLLVAMPSLKTPQFSNTVVLLVRYSAKGAVGLIINRPTKITLASEFEELVSEPHAGDTLFWGGPVGMNRRVMLVERGQDEGPDTGTPHRTLMDRLYVVNNWPQFQHMLQQDQPRQRFRIYVGYAGWGASQLEHEIIRGDWIVMPGNADLVLQSDTQSIWPQLISYRRGKMAAISPAAASVAGG